MCAIPINWYDWVWGESEEKKPKPTPLPRCTDKRATDKKASRQKGQKRQTKGPQTKRPKKQTKGPKTKNILIAFSMKILFLQCNKTDLELDLFEDLGIFVVWLGRFAPFTK